MKLSKNKGITLIALVITIVVLLILAGISISALTQTGLFGKAKQAEQMASQQTQEQGQLPPDQMAQAQIPQQTGNQNKPSEKSKGTE